MISQDTHDRAPAAVAGRRPRGHPGLPGTAGRRLILRGPGMLAAAATAVMLAASLAGPAAAAPATTKAAAVRLTPATAVPRCLKNDLIAGLHGQESGTQGGRSQGGFILTLTNNSERSCSLYGYPGLGLQDARHHVLHSKTHWGPTIFARDPGRHTIVLSPGETATASVAFAYVGARHPLHAAYLEITPPNGYDHAVVAIPYGLGNISDGNLYVTAMARHTAYTHPAQRCCL